MTHKTLFRQCANQRYVGHQHGVNDPFLVQNRFVMIVVINWVAPDHVLLMPKRGKGENKQTRQIINATT